MSLPTEADFAIIKRGDGATPTEAFTVLCGISNVTIGRSAQSSDRYVRDCAKPGEVPVRRQRITGKSLEVSGSGLTNVDQIEDFEEALGRRYNYLVELYEDDNTDAGNLLGTIAYASKMTTANMAINRDGDATADVTLPNDGPWTYTPAP